MMRNLMSIVMLVLAIGLFLVYTKPTYDSAQALQAQVASYDAALSKAAELQQRKQALLSKYNAMNPTDLDKLQKLLPDHVDNVALILDFDNLARQYGMALENVDVAIPGASDATKGTITANPTGSSKYEAVMIRFSTRGTYATFQEFLRGLQSSLRIVDLVTLGMAPANGAPGQQTTEPVYTYDVALRTYWLK